MYYQQHFKYIRKRWGGLSPTLYIAEAGMPAAANPEHGNYDAFILYARSVAECVDEIQDTEVDNLNNLAARQLLQTDPRYQGVLYEYNHHSARRYFAFEGGPRFYFCLDIQGQLDQAFNAAAAWIRANPPTQEQREQRIADARLVRQQEGLE